MALPTHRIEIRKSIGAQHWANDYLVSVADMATAASAAAALLAMERQIHCDVVTFDYYRVSTVAKGDRVFRHVAVGLQGQIVTGSNQYLPLFNTFRANLTTSDSDPARKYYRLPILEAQSNNGVLDTATVNGWVSAINAVLTSGAASGVIVTNKGHGVLACQGTIQVQERQLARRRRARAL